MLCDDFLVGGICVCVLVGGARSCLSERQWLCQLVCFGMYRFSMALSSQSADVQGCALIWLKDRRGVCGTRACWPRGVA